MTNSNDLLEYEESNLEQLEEYFLMQYKHEHLRAFILHDESIMSKFKDTFKGDWSTHVEESYTNHNTGGH